MALLEARAAQKYNLLRPRELTAKGSNKLLAQAARNSPLLTQWPWLLAISGQADQTVSGQSIAFTCLFGTGAASDTGRV